MKKLNRYLTIAFILIAIPFRFTLAQNTLGKIWEHDRDFHHSDAGRLIQAYHDNVSNLDYTVTVALLDDYSKLNLSKFDQEGNLMWTKNLGNSDLSYWTPRKMIVDANGDTYLSGDTYSSQQLLNMIFVCKVNSSGSVEWFNLEADPTNYISFSGLDADGENVYLSYWFSEYDIQGNITSHIETSKLDGATGETVWENELEFSSYAATTALIHDVSGTYQTGYISNANNTGYDILILKHDDSGNLAWQTTYSTGKNFIYSQGSDLVVNGNGDLVVAGTLDYHRLVTLGYSQDGSWLYTNVKAFGTASYVYNIQIDDNTNGSTYVVCEADNIEPKIYLAQYDDNGSKVWDQNFNGSYFVTMKANWSGDGATILGSVYDNQKHNYFPRLYGVDASGNLTFMRQLNTYKGYGAVADFSTTEGNSYYLCGTVKQNNLYTDQMTSRWDVQPLRLGNYAESLSSISVFPNPCSETATIHFNTTSSNDVFVYDAIGRLMTSYRNVSGDLSLNTENWSSGQYFIKVGNEQTIKLTKE